MAVELYLSDGTLAGSTVTNGEGQYAFSNLNADLQYYLEFTAPAGYGWTTANAAADSRDSDPDPMTGRTAAFNVAVGSNNDWDAGLVRLGTIGGTVFNDANGDGDRDDGEGALSGWTVLLDSDGNGLPDDNRTTGADGTYRFEGLRPGTYIVTVQLPAGWEQTAPGESGVVWQTVQLGVRAAGIAIQSSSAPDADGSAAARDLIRLDQLRTDSRFANLDGSGCAVAIIDTGIDADHPFFGPDSDQNGVADRIVFQYDFAGNDGEASDSTGHGTHVASIIGSSDAVHGGVAPGVNIILLKVFDDGGTGVFSQAERALQWVANNAALYNIVAVNVSFGDGRNWDWPDTTDCGCGGTIRRETYGLSDDLAVLRSMNILVSAAAGNSFFEYGGVQGLNYPAADPATISVGAVWAGDFGGPWHYQGTGATDFTTGVDRLAAFSQRQADYIDVFAPGTVIAGAANGGGVTTMHGTSQATAFVTGAAVLAQQLALEHLHRPLTLSEFRTLLATTGATIHDGDDENDNVINTGQAYTRLDVYALAEAIVSLDPNQPPDDAGGDGGDSGGNGGVEPLGGQPYAYQVVLAPGAEVLNAHFGAWQPTPPTASGLLIAPDTGVSATDGITSAYSVMLSGTVSRAGVTVTVFDVTSPDNPTNLGSAAVTGTTFSSQLNFATAGPHSVRVHVEDAAGRYSDVISTVTIDTSAPYVVSATEHRVAGEGSGVTGIAARFSEATSVGNLVADGSIVTAVGLFRLRDGQPPEALPLTASQFSWDAATDTLTWTLNSTDPTAALPPGSYEFHLDSARIIDLAGNYLAGNGGGVIAFNAPAFTAPVNLQTNGADIQVNAWSVPSLADFNGDGVNDLIVGEKVDETTGKVRVYLNTGTNAAPIYTGALYVQLGGADLTVPASGCLGVFPRLVDWDRDGQRDLVVGLADGTLEFFAGIGAGGGVTLTEGRLIQAGDPGAKSDINVGARATFDVADWNNDGLPDLVVGALDRAIRVYLNRAADGEPDLASPIILQAGATDLVVPTGRSSVSVYDLNGDGRKDLVVGNTEGQLLTYLNVGSDAAPAFAGYQALSVNGVPIDLTGQARSRPFVADVNGDAIPDVLLGVATVWCGCISGNKA